MPLSNEIIQAARQLGRALRQTETVEAYLESNEKLKSDPQVSRLLAEVHERRQQLAQKELCGAILSSFEASQYHNLVDQANRSPLVTQQEDNLRAVQSLFARTSETLSSRLSIDYASMVVEE